MATHFLTKLFLVFVVFQAYSVLADENVAFGTHENFVLKTPNNASDIKPKHENGTMIEVLVELKKHILRLDTFSNTKAYYATLLRLYQTGDDNIVSNKTQIDEVIGSDLQALGINIKILNGAGFSKEKLVDYLEKNAKEITNHLLDILNIFLVRLKVDGYVFFNREQIRAIVNMFELDTTSKIYPAVQFRKIFTEQLNLWIEDWHVIGEYLSDMKRIPSCDEKDAGCNLFYMMHSVFYGASGVSMETEKDGKATPVTYFPPKQPVEGDCPWSYKKMSDNGCYPECPYPLQRVSSATCSGYILDSHAPKLSSVIENMIFSQKHGFLWREKLEWIYRRAQKQSDREPQQVNFYF
jgi:hypothetical protein